MSSHEDNMLQIDDNELGCTITKGDLLNGIFQHMLLFNWSSAKLCLKSLWIAPWTRKRHE